jgi:transposase
MTDSLILGIDPAKEKFTAAFFAPAAAQEPGPAADYPMSREGLAQLAQAITARLAPGQRLIAGIEATAALDDNLLAWFAAQRGRWPLTLLRLDAGQVARFSGARPVRGKTDKADARRIAAFSAAHARALDAFERDEEAQALGRLARERMGLIAERTALKNRLHDRLVITFPEFTSVLHDPATPLARAVLRAAPTAARAARRTVAALAAIAPKTPHAHALGLERAGRLRALGAQSIASATGAQDGEAIVYLLDLLELLERRVACIDRELSQYQARAGAATATATETAPRSIPAQIARLAAMRGIGTVGAATIVLGAGGLARFASPKALAAQLGTCPERRQTGKTMDLGRLTTRGDRRARSMLYMLTLALTQFDPGLAFHRFMMRARGQKPKQAICSCMNRLARIMWAVATGAAPYDPRRVIDNARRHHAELWIKFVAQTRTNRKLWKNHEDYLQ